VCRNQVYHKPPQADWRVPVEQDSLKRMRRKDAADEPVRIGSSGPRRDDEPSIYGKERGPTSCEGQFTKGGYLGTSSRVVKI